MAWMQYFPGNGQRDENADGFQTHSASGRTRIHAADARRRQALPDDENSTNASAKPILMLPTDEPMDLSSLPPDMIAEIAFCVKGFGAMHSIVQFDLCRVASTRIQRMYHRVRDTKFSPHVHDLQVGDRVLYRSITRHSQAHCLALSYGTADGEVSAGVWKVRLVDGRVVQAKLRQVYRLSPWASYPCSLNIPNAVSHAASAAREAATMAARAALAVVHSPTTTAGGEEMQLALAAASAASTAASAATVAASVLIKAGHSRGKATTPCSAMLDPHTAMAEAHGLLEAHEHLVNAAGRAQGTAMADEPLTAGADAAMAQAHRLLAARETAILTSQQMLQEGCSRQSPRYGPAVSSSCTLTTRATQDLLREATAAAAAASSEAAVATHAASQVCDLSATTGAVNATATVTHDLVAATDAIAGFYSSELRDPLRVAADAIGAIGVVQDQLSTSCLLGSASSARGDASAAAGSFAQAHERALSATQRAASSMAAAADAAAVNAEKEQKLAVARSELDCALPEGTTLCRSETPCRVPADIDALVRNGHHAVLWCWLPRANHWTTRELIERCTRAVAACRTDDHIALPDLPLARELVDHWDVTNYGADRVRKANVIWFDPAPPAEAGGGDPALATLTHVLEEHASCGRRLLPKMACTALFCMYPDARTASLAARYGLSCLGDLEDHPIVGPLSRAKSFLHRSLDNPARPALCDAVLGTARGPRGFCCTTAEQLHEAWEELTTSCPGIRLVLKPAAGSGGSGVVIDATRADADALAEHMPRARQGRFVVRSTGGSHGDDTIVEEMVGMPGKPSPTVYMVGRRVAVVADQLLSPCGTINLGNVSPATQVAPSIVDSMSQACVELGTYLGLVGQWGVDFVLDDDGTPVMVDLNMGRPNGSLSYYCWRARQHEHNDVDVENIDTQRAARQRPLALVASTYPTPEGLRLAPFAASLKAAGLLWDGTHTSGVILAQHLPGFPDGGTVLAASWEGVDAAQRTLEAFRMHAESHSHPVED